jgi:hypothetical protein
VSSRWRGLAPSAIAAPLSAKAPIAVGRPRRLQRNYGGAGAEPRTLSVGVANASL